MFPDGGYPIGHPYGESAHWEPLQTRYLDWIRSTFDLPYDRAAAPHIAFLMGLGSHGLADQTFDAFYLDRSQRYDADLGWAEGLSMDEATDFKWASLRGTQTVPERWIPDEVLTEIFAQEGIEVDGETMHQGQGLLELAIGLVTVTTSSDGDLSRYEEAFPWATENLENPDVPGIPDYETEVVASYWLSLWEQLHARDPSTLIDRTWPVDGGYGLATDATSPDARISIVFQQGLLSAELEPDFFSVEDSSGTDHPVDIWLYYGDHSHIIHLVPRADWPADDWMTVTLRAGLPTRTGATLATNHVFSVSTQPPPEDSGTLPESTPTTDAPTKRRCGCTLGAATGVPLQWFWLACSGPLICMRRRPHRGPS
ncbi:MAG: hypothetical protein CL927_11310 [Deltaproteobacteria bacterium]|nr:hypothetical protein [Deltaproteobacteria bacterium]